MELKLKKHSVQKNYRMHEIDFSESDLCGSTFENCDLMRAIFENTKLEKVNFSSVFNYAIDPFKNDIKKARFSFPGILALLNRFDIVTENR